MGLYITLARKNDTEDSCSTTQQDDKVYELELNWDVLQSYAASTHSSSALAKNVALRTLCGLYTYYKRK